MTSEDSVWYRLGHAIERARHPRAPSRRVAGLNQRQVERKGGGPIAIPSVDELIATGIGVAVDRGIALWSGRRPPGLLRLVGAGAAGACAAVVVELLRPILTGDEAFTEVDGDVVDDVLHGVAQGLLYGGVVEPRVPGPALLKGATFGSAEYAADPVGGLGGVLGHHAPQAGLPVVGDALAEALPRDRSYLEHLAFGIALAMIYELGFKSGILPDEE